MGARRWRVLVNGNANEGIKADDRSFDFAASQAPRRGQAGTR